MVDLQSFIEGTKYANRSSGGSCHDFVDSSWILSTLETIAETLEGSKVRYTYSNSVYVAKSNVDFERVEKLIETVNKTYNENWKLISCKGLSASFRFLCSSEKRSSVLAISIPVITNEDEEERIAYYTVVSTKPLSKELFYRFYWIARRLDIIRPFRTSSDNVIVDFVFLDGRSLKRVTRPIRSYKGGEYKYENYKELLERIMYFLESSPENILVLEGPPGTGKSTIIADALTELYKSKKLYHEDVKCLMDSNILGMFSSLVLDSKIIILENAESLVMDRRHSVSDSIRKLLELSDGLFTSRNPLKFLISLNTKDTVDSALIRPGRGEIINIPPLTKKFVKERTFIYAIEELSSKFNFDPEKERDRIWRLFIESTGDKSEYTLAEVFGVTHRIVDDKFKLRPHIERKSTSIGFRIPCLVPDRPVTACRDDYR